MKNVNKIFQEYVRIILNYYERGHEGIYIIKMFGEYGLICTGGCGYGEDLKDYILETYNTIEDFIILKKTNNYLEQAVNDLKNAKRVPFNVRKLLNNRLIKKNLKYEIFVLPVFDDDELLKFQDLLGFEIIEKIL